MIAKRYIHGRNYYTHPLPIIDLSVSHQFAYSLVFYFTPRAITSFLITHYEVHLNGTYYGNITGPDSSISGLTPGTLYSNITIVAVDESGGKSPHSNPVNATTGNPAVVQTSGLVLSYAMEGLSGAVVDGSVNGLDGTLQGTGTTRGNAGFVNNCFKFDTNGVIETLDSPLLRTTDGVNVGKIAFSVWINTDAFDNNPNQYYFLFKGATSDATGIEYQFLWNGMYMNFSSYNKDGSPALVYRRNVREYEIGEKVLFSGIMDFQSKIVQLFKNGIELPGTHNLIGSGGLDLNLSDSPLHIGGGISPEATINYSGLMDEFRFWNGNIPHPAYFMDEYNNGNGITL